MVGKTLDSFGSIGPYFVSADGVDTILYLELGWGARGHTVRFATPDGLPGRADERMLTGRGLGIWKALLRADANALQAYAEMVASPEFTQPGRHSESQVADFDGLILPGGHAP